MLEIKQNIDLSEFNTFGIPARCKSMIILNSESELEFLPSIVSQYSGQLILGEGSNILFTQDFDGLVIVNRIAGIKFEPREEKSVEVIAGGGENWDNLVRTCCENEYYGVENLSLIPGTAGAAPIQNIGAYGVELKDIFSACETFDIFSGEKREFNLADCEFGYRSSVFKRKYKNRLLVTKLRLNLSKEKKFNLSYQPLTDRFSQYENSLLTANDVREFVIKVRESKLPDPAKLGNAGSFFKNPELSVSEFETFKEKNGEVRCFKTEAGFKIPAAWLIEQSGLKGCREGNVGTHPQQPLVIVNYGVKTGIEIMEFAKKVQNRIFDKFGIMLEPEVNII